MTTRRFLQVLLGHRLDRFLREALHLTQLDPLGLAVVGGFDSGDERPFSGAAAATLAVGTFAAEIGVVHFDATIERLSGLPLHHDLGELVLDLPGRRLRHAEASPQLDRGDALLRLRQVIHGREPDRQRQFRRGENGARDRRRLPLAARALEETTRIRPAGFQVAVPGPAARGTFKPVRPAPSDDEREALLLAAIEPAEFRFRKPFLELHLVARHA